LHEGGFFNDENSTSARIAMLIVIAETPVQTPPGQPPPPYADPYAK